MPRVVPMVNDSVCSEGLPSIIFFAPDAARSLSQLRHYSHDHPQTQVRIVQYAADRMLGESTKQAANRIGEEITRIYTMRTANRTGEESTTRST